MNTTKQRENQAAKMLDLVRRRILDDQEDRALKILGGQPFAVRTPCGRFVDPWALTEEERLQWVESVWDAMSDMRETVRIADFMKGWAGLDKDHRERLLDENSRLFASARIDYMKALTDCQCASLVKMESWQVGDLLTNNGPIFGSRLELDVEFGIDAPSPAFAQAA